MSAAARWRSRICRNADFDEGLGTSGIEIGLDVTSVKTEDADLPPGPNTDASMAAPELAAQQAVVKEIDLPKDIPTEAENADRVVTENDSRKPAEEEPEKAAVQTAASTPSLAAEATAQQKLDEGREAEQSQARHEGILKDNKKLAAEWGRQLSAYLERHKRYPKVRDRQERQGQGQFRNRSPRQGIDGGGSRIIRRSAVR